jgi:hypothetical protein
MYMYIFMFYPFIGREPKCTLFLPLEQIHLRKGSSTLNFFFVRLFRTLPAWRLATFKSLANVMPPDTLFAHFHQRLLFRGVPVCV